MPKVRSLMIAFLVLLVIAGLFIQPVLAQNCWGVHIDDTQSQYKFDVEVLCKAAASWTSRGVEVYILLTDFAPASPQAWFDYLDQWEIQQTFRDSENLLKPSAIAFEASTMNPNDFASAITIPSTFDHTLLWDDGERALLNGQFRIELMSGDYERAFVQVMDGALRMVFPPPPLPTNTPLPTATTDPLVLTQQAVAMETQRAYEFAAQGTQAAIQSTQQQAEREAQATQAAIQSTQQQAEREAQATQTALQLAQQAVEEANRAEKWAQFLQTLGQIGLVILVVMVGSALIIFVIIPVVRAVQHRRRYEGQAVELQLRINNLLLAIEGLLRDEKLDKPVGSVDDYQQTALFAMWKAYGGTKYPDQNEQVVGWLQSIIRTHALAYENFDKLKQTTDLSVEALVRELEVIYLTLIGQTADILGMSQVQQEQLLNPLTGLSVEVIGDKLYTQMAEQFQRLEGGETLQLSLMEVNPSEVDAEGVMGHVKSIKAALQQLQDAKNVALPTLQAAEAELENRRTQTSFDATILPAEVALAYAQARLEFAKAAMTDDRWLDVNQAADQVLTFVRKLDSVVVDYITAVREAEVRLGSIQQLEVVGYKLEDLNPLVQEVTDDYVQFKAALAAGNLAKAAESTREVGKDSKYVLEQAVARQTLHQANLRRLEELSMEVARVRGLATDDAQPALDALRAYPKSNWGTAEADFARAATIITQLFDDPANAEDLSSAIQRRNALEGSQDFQGAQEDLVAAFAQLQEAERLFQAVEGQVSLVHEMEQQVEAALKAAQKDLQTAGEFRDGANEKVDATVDLMIAEAEAKIEQAQVAIKNREFSTASEQLASARELANKAHKEAGDQAAAIDNALEALSNTRRQAQQALSAATMANDNLPTPAKIGEVALMITAAETALQAAQQAEQRIAGQQDDAWLTALHEVTDLYQAAEDKATQAKQRADAEDERYQDAYRAAEQSIRQASSAISTAYGYVSDSDAGSAGESALRRANSALPTMAAAGVSYEALRQMEQQARQAREAAQQAQREAQSRIEEVEAEREEAARRRQAVIDEQNRRDREAAAERQRQLDRQRDAERARDAEARRQAESRMEASRRTTNVTASRRDHNVPGKR